MKRTIIDLINDLGEIPYCKCNCGNKVNIVTRRYSQYKNCGYPKFIKGHKKYDGKNNPFYNHKHTKEAKNKVKLAKLEFYSVNPDFNKGKNHPLYGKCGKKNARYGKIPSHGKKIYSHVTSIQGEILMYRWDELYATYLELIGRPYLYEYQYFQFKFNNRECTYTPDFYLPDTNEYIEIKGYWRGNSKEKFKTFKEIYPQIKIKILMKKELKNLGINLNGRK